jgi:hypothetical protein
MGETMRTTNIFSSGYKNRFGWGQRPEKALVTSSTHLEEVFAQGL